jgi:ABC-type nitrate/sulfonate/bicarbonate transport system permease component
VEGLPASTRAFLSVVALALGYWGSHSAIVRRFCSYSAAILVMIYLFSLGGIFIAGQIPAKWEITSAGFLVGMVVGIAVGILVGRFGVNNSVLYWLLIVLVAGVITWLPPLF